MGHHLSDHKRMILVNGCWESSAALVWTHSQEATFQICAGSYREITGLNSTLIITPREGEKKWGMTG